MNSILILICGLCGIFSAAPQFVLLSQAGVTQTPAASAGANADNASASPTTDQPAAAPAESKDESAADGKAADDAAAKDEESAATESGGFWAWVDELLHSGAMGLMIQGGIFMWPILLMGIVAFAVIIERYRSLKMLGTDTQA
ncbi:MAG: hypothetical protein ACKO2P_21390, partial [Planctomycetota bacterium]